MPSVIQRALISVSDKTNLLPFAKKLSDKGIEIISTGGTFKVLQEAGIQVTELSTYTEFPEMMDGRVKSLHPKVFGGILGRRDCDAQVMQDNDIHDIDLVVVNLYPFEQTIQNPSCTLSGAIEQIDIGGPSLLRAAAKNHAWVTVVVSPLDYDKVFYEMELGKGTVSSRFRLELATKAFAHTARYDGLIADHLGRYRDVDQCEDTSRYQHFQFTLDKSLRYGENPQQAAAMYRETTDNQTTLPSAEQVQGKPLSFNNIVDLNAAMECCYHFDTPSCVIVKHANPCGVACEQDLTKAYHKAFACDPTSSFGGIIAFNKTVDGDLIDTIMANQFVEAVCAPDFTKDAIERAKQKPNVRLLATHSASLDFENLYPDFKRIRGGLLTQGWDSNNISAKDCEVVTRSAPSEQQWHDLLFAWKVAKFVKSNAIVIANQLQTVGIGAGQMSRVFSVTCAKLKAQEAKLNLEHSALASDAFFPFKDNIEYAHQAGVKAIIQPGGSMRDKEVIQACDDFGISMVFTGIRHFRH